MREFPPIFFYFFGKTLIFKILWIHKCNFKILWIHKILIPKIVDPQNLKSRIRDFCGSTSWQVEKLWIHKSDFQILWFSKFWDSAFLDDCQFQDCKGLKKNKIHPTMARRRWVFPLANVDGWGWDHGLKCFPGMARASPALWNERVRAVPTPGWLDMMHCFVSIRFCIDFCIVFLCVRCDRLDSRQAFPQKACLGWKRRASACGFMIWAGFCDWRHALMIASVPHFVRKPQTDGP